MKSKSVLCHSVTCISARDTHHATYAVRDAGRSEQKLTQLAPVRLLVWDANAGQLQESNINCLSISQ